MLTVAPRTPLRPLVAAAGSVRRKSQFQESTSHPSDRYVSLCVRLIYKYNGDRCQRDKWSSIHSVERDSYNDIQLTTDAPGPADRIEKRLFVALTRIYFLDPQ